MAGLFTLSEVTSICGQDIGAIQIRPAELPSGPLVAKVQNNSTWRVTLEPGMGEADRSATIEIHAYANGIERTKIEVGGDDVTFQYVVEDHVIFFREKSGTIVALTPAQLAREGLRYAAGRLLEFEWINKGNFRGVATFRGKECDVFQRRNAEGAKLGATALSGNAMITKVDGELSAFRTALIDRTTRLPVAYDDGSVMRFYEWGTLKESLVIPEPLQLALQKARDGARQRQLRYKIPQ